MTRVLWSLLLVAVARVGVLVKEGSGRGALVVTTTVG